MLSPDDTNTIRGAIFGVLDSIAVSETAYNIIAAALDQVTEDALDSYQTIKQKDASWAHMSRALRLAAEDMANLVGPCTGEPPRPEHVRTDPTEPGEGCVAASAWYTLTEEEAREAATTWYADWLERAEEEATHDA